MKSCRLLICLLLLLAGLPVCAQRDSISRTDTLRVLPADSARLAADTVRRDSFVIPPLVIVPRRYDSVALRAHPFFRFRDPIRLRESVHQAGGKEAVFYCAMGLLLLFAIARNLFARYLQDLFRLFFRAGARQRQAKEQLQQTPLPSLVLNLLFFASAGLFLVLVFRRYGMGNDYGFWELLGYTAAGLAALYLGKYIALRIIGWVFRVPAAMEAYVFIIFTANKILGIVLLPFTVLFAFSGNGLAQAALSMSIILAGGVIAYRYFLSYINVQRQVRLGFLHFLLYVLAFEVAPLLLINKLLFRFLG